MAQSFIDLGNRTGEPVESRLRLQTIIRLRWFGLVGQLLTVAVVYLAFGFEFPVGYCLLFIAISAWVNVFLRLRYAGRHRLSANFATVLLAYDTLQLVALLYLTGGIENPFVVLIVAPVTVSAATLPRRHTMALGALAFVSTALLLLLRTWPLPWYAGQRLDLPAIYELGLFAAVTACMLFLGIYTWRLSKEARQMSAALAATELVLAREQQLHALDGLAAAAAHELGTPLATIVLVTKELEREIAPGTPLANDVALLRSQAQRCREILQKLTRQPSEPDPLHSTVTVTQLLAEATEPHRVSAVRIEIDARATTTNGAGEASAEPVGQRRPGLIYGLGNLVENAVDFAQERVRIMARWSDEKVEVTIEDDGPGFPPDLMDTLGEPYVTTRPAARLGAEAEQAGLGLGFFIAKTLLERSGASIELDNRKPPERGALVRIVWPRSAFEGRGSLQLEAAEGSQVLGG